MRKRIIEIDSSTTVSPTMIFVPVQCDSSQTRATPKGKLGIRNVHSGRASEVIAMPKLYSMTNRIRKILANLLNRCLRKMSFTSLHDPPLAHHLGIVYGE
jgi:hypothetical protein